MDSNSTRILFWIIGCLSLVISLVIGNIMGNKKIDKNNVLFICPTIILFVCIILSIIYNNVFFICIFLVSAISYYAAYKDCGDWKGIFMDATANKEKEQNNLKVYDIDTNKRNLIKIVSNITNNKINNCDFIKDNTTEDFINYLYDNGYIARFYFGMELGLTVRIINKILKNLDYDITIKNEDILEKDNNEIAKRRRKGYSTILHDVNIISEILREHDLELINIYSKYYGFYRYSKISKDNFYCGVVKCIKK
ncbi:MAG: hypothetical protein J6A89_04960 [Clostridia bacterium]|nr:hypothetical protein [Clostridia bacterium]